MRQEEGGSELANPPQSPGHGEGERPESTAAGPPGVDSGPSTTLRASKSSPRMTAGSSTSGEHMSHPKEPPPWSPSLQKHNELSSTQQQMG